MALVLEQLLFAELGDASYLVGDDAARVCAIIDPQVDVQRYLAAARRHGLAIRHVVQTHVHEDFLSGVHALAEAAGVDAWVSGHEAPPYGFPHRLLHDGDTLELGSLRLAARHTPGHTPEHIALLLSRGGEADAPLAVFSGGSLLAGTAGRTDLLGDERKAELTRAQFATLIGFYRALDEGVLVYPTHVHGSPCGAAIGDRLVTSIGHEKRHNALLQCADAQAFAREALAALPPKPSYYPRLKQRNSGGPAGHGGTPKARALAVDAFRAAVDDPRNQLVDTRHMLAFGGGHVPGAWNFGAAGHLAIQAGWMLDAERPLLLVLADDEQLDTVLAHLARTGFERIAGYLAGGMAAWQAAGEDIERLPQWHVRELAAALHEPADPPTVVDVRARHEWEQGHVPGARHVFLPELRARLGELPREAQLAVYCDSGYRASIAASLLQAEGFRVANVPGSWQAWQACGLPVA